MLVPWMQLLAPKEIEEKENPPAQAGESCIPISALKMHSLHSELQECSPDFFFPLEFEKNKSK